MGAFGGTVRGEKVTMFYKVGAFCTFFAAIFGSFEVGLRSRRDGHYDSNDHRERKNDGFRVVRKLPFSPPPPPRRAYRQVVDGQKALARRLSTENVYLYILGKNFTNMMGGAGNCHWRADGRLSARRPSCRVVFWSVRQDFWPFWPLHRFFWLILKLYCRPPRAWH